MKSFKCNCSWEVRVLMALSFLSLVLTVLVSVFGLKLWLAGTQWILIAILLAVYANHLQHCHNSTCSSEENDGSQNE